MPSTFFGLNIGTSGLYAYQAGLNTTAHNVTNAEIEGYTRQVVDLTAGKAIHVNSTYGMAGTGVVVNGVVQIRNAYYDLKFRDNNALYGEYSTKNYYMTEIQNYFNEVSVDGFTTIFDNFNSSLQELTKDPSNTAIKTQVTNYAQSLTEYFNYMSISLKGVQKEANSEIKNQVDKVNSIAEQVASLTKQILALEVRGGIANDLRDTRNRLIDELSQIANVTVEEVNVTNATGTSQYLVKIDGQLLVDTSDYNSLKVVSRVVKSNQEDEEGLYDVVWSKTNTKFNLKSSTLGGTLQALAEVRDGTNSENFRGSASGTIGQKTLTITDTNINNITKLNIPENGKIIVDNIEYSYTDFEVNVDTNGKYTYTINLSTPLIKDAVNGTATIGETIDYKGIPYYMSQLNEFVRTYALEFNKIHNQGVDINGEKGLDFFNGKDAVTGENFILSEEKTSFSFDSLSQSYYKITAKNFTVTDKLLKTPSLMATSSNATAGAENNDIVQKLLALKTDKTAFHGTAASFINTLVAEIGVNGSKAKNFEQNQKNIITSIDNQRLSISGVDTDEEAMNLVRYQNAYNLSAKVISVMNEVYNKLINEMGV